ncbi:hypothetical protein 7S2_23 [uncultured Caudovirales phage]|uniref:Uncharacterized protein n=1 Tax=uncultured Caudovirales phage TaxID=2100421 RepID=A0A2H4JG21_9CAUD|nr:hypothetical protein 7S2_23 [uncultured Caudovirales phage]
MTDSIFRVAVEAWPTPDGKPFTEQDDAFWIEIVDSWNDKREAYPAPDWLPADFANYLFTPVYMDGWHGGLGAGRTVYDYDNHPVVNVPSLSRKHFLSRHAAKKRVDQLVAWGVTAHLETASIGEVTR